MSRSGSSFIITGAPGTGKSTLLESLREKGYCCYAEISRQVIREELDKGTRCLPWRDIIAFSEKVLHRMEHQLEEIPADRISFLDRGIPDLIAYLRNAGYAVPDVFWKNAFPGRYSKTVFIAPPWERIYVEETERPESFEQALSIQDSLRSTYEELGYELLTLPKASPEERCRFIEEQMKVLL